MAELENFYRNLRLNHEHLVEGIKNLREMLAKVEREIDMVSRLLEQHSENREAYLERKVALVMQVLDVERELGDRDLAVTKLWLLTNKMLLNT